MLPLGGPASGTLSVTLRPCPDPSQHLSRPLGSDPSPTGFALGGCQSRPPVLAWPGDAPQGRANMGPLGVRSQAGLLGTVPYILPTDLPLLGSPDPSGRSLFAQIIQGPFCRP